MRPTRCLPVSAVCPRQRCRPHTPRPSTCGSGWAQLSPLLAYSPLGEAGLAPRVRVGIHFGHGDIKLDPVSKGYGRSVAALLPPLHCGGCERFPVVHPQDDRDSCGVSVILLLRAVW